MHNEKSTDKQIRADIHLPGCLGGVCCCTFWWGYICKRTFSCNPDRISYYYRDLGSNHMTDTHKDKTKSCITRKMHLTHKPSGDLLSRKTIHTMDKGRCILKMDGFEVPRVFYLNPDIPNILTCDSHECR